MQNVRNMPIGIQSFEIIRTCPYVYVDKTRFISLLEKTGRAYFLTRPRRFGKSLFISTLQAYFEGRKELFKGLFIEKFKVENNLEWQSYPVLKLDLNAQEYTEKKHLITILNDNIEKWKKTYDVEFDATDPVSAFTKIIEALYKKFNKRVIVLIDEYDKPLVSTLENKELQEQYRATLKAFYSVIKSSNDYLHFSFLTGVTKFSKISIFSDLNNLSDISFDDEYSTICGITEKELMANFLSEIASLANKYNMNQVQMLDILRAKYDGYRFSENEERIYNPFSLFNVFDKKKLGNYWFESATPTFMVRLLEQQYLNIPDMEGNIKFRLGDMDEYRIGHEDLIPLLFQAGYLTIKDYSERDDRCVLGYPNDEVKYGMLRRLMKVYTTEHTLSDGEFKIDVFTDAMQAGDIDRLLTLIKALMASIPYDSLPEDKLFLREHNYQVTIYLIFRLMGEYARCEVHSAQGRSDVEVETQDSIYIFEFKVGGKPLDAITQIKDAGYAEKYKVSSKNIFLIGATISRNKRTLSKWQIEKLNNSNNQHMHSYLE